MKNAESILKEKGYDNEQIMSILAVGHDSLDMQTREKYGVEEEPIHIYDGYYIGDADEEKVNEIAKSQGFDDYEDMFLEMDSYLSGLADDYPESENPHYLVKSKNLWQVQKFWDEEEAQDHYQQLDEVNNAEYFYEVSADGKTVDYYTQEEI